MIYRGKMKNGVVVFDDEAASAGHLDATVVAGDGVAFDTVLSAGGVNARAVAARDAITVAGVVEDQTRGDRADAIAPGTLHGATFDRRGTAHIHSHAGGRSKGCGRIHIAYHALGDEAFSASRDARGKRARIGAASHDTADQIARAQGGDA